MSDSGYAAEIYEKTVFGSETLRQNHTLDPPPSNPSEWRRLWGLVLRIALGRIATRATLRGWTRGRGLRQVEVQARETGEVDAVAQPQPQRRSCVTQGELLRKTLPCHT